MDKKKKKLNIGCGLNKIEGFINIDKSKEVNPDMVVDIEKGMPFANNTFEHIYSDHCLEHIEPQNWRFVLNEISRIAKDGCLLELKLPYDNSGQRTNADHFRTFSWKSFNQLLNQGRRHDYSKLRLKRLHRIPNKFVRLFFYLFPFLKYEVHFKFRIVKQ